MAVTFSALEAAAGAAIVPAGALYVQSGSLLAAGTAYVVTLVTSLFGVGILHALRTVLPQLVSGVAAVPAA